MRIVENIKSVIRPPSTFNLYDLTIEEMQEIRAGLYQLHTDLSADLFCQFNRALDAYIQQSA